MAIVNTYYLGLLQNSSLSADREVAEKLKIFFPNQAGRGTHINISGAGVTKACRHPEQALQLLEFLVSEPAQAIFPAATYEYSVLAGAPLSKLHAGWGPFKADQCPLVCWVTIMWLPLNFSTKRLALAASTPALPG